MPRSAKGPRLFLRRRGGREPVYVILDSGGHEASTGCGPRELEKAEAALARYIAGKHQSAVGTHDPRALPVADVLNFYAEAKLPAPGASKARLALYDNMTCMVAILIAFFGMRPTTDVRGATCRDYIRWRTHEGAAVKGWPTRRPRAVSDQTARRELVILSAAINLYHKEYTLDMLPVVTLPKMAQTKRRALTRSEAAALLAGALGFYRDEAGTLRRRQRSTRTQRRRTARFILIGLYSGTRHSAIVAARWLPSVDAPWVDVEKGILYRRGAGEEVTNKRRPPARIPPRLLAHLRRWQRLDMGGEEPCPLVISRAGPGLVGQIRKGWAGARADGGLAAVITPHWLRHTAGTWLAQGGVRARVAADYLGMSEEVFERTYYSAHPDWQAEIGPAFERSRRSAAPKDAQTTREKP